MNGTISPNTTYTKLINTLVSGLTYADGSGTTYQYVVTAVNAQGVESVYSAPATAAIP